jgi:beta-lactamase superfamily II metal-dependent hydrolase
MLDVERLAEPGKRQDTATANGSSISVLIEYDGKRMLLAADAHPAGLIAGIKGLGLPLPLKVDVFKLPHHGSKFNVVSELLALVETKVIVFSSNGKKFHHPDREAVARVVKHYGASVELVFNYASDETIVWDDQELKSVWGYTTRYGVGAAGISLSIV